MSQLIAERPLETHQAFTTFLVASGSSPRTIPRATHSTPFEGEPSTASSSIPEAGAHRNCRKGSPGMGHDRAPQVGVPWRTWGTDPISFLANLPLPVPEACDHMKGSLDNPAWDQAWSRPESDFLLSDSRFFAATFQRTHQPRVVGKVDVFKISEPVS